MKVWNIKAVAGPNPNASGGFTVTFGEFEKVLFAIAKCNQDEVLGAADTAYALHTSMSCN